jgi:hypothetical protein
MRPANAGCAANSSKSYLFHGNFSRVKCDMKTAIKGKNNKAAGCRARIRAPLNAT